MKRTSKATAHESPDKQMAGFIAKVDPSIANLLRSLRRAVRRRLPTAIEQVYDNCNFLAIGYCTTERTSDCIISLAASANGVALSFYYGATLPDTQKILQGSGNQNRFIRLKNAKMLAEPVIEALVRAVSNRRRHRCQWVVGATLSSSPCPLNSGRVGWYRPPNACS